MGHYACAIDQSYMGQWKGLILWERACSYTFLCMVSSEKLYVMYKKITLHGSTKSSGQKEYFYATIHRGLEVSPLVIHRHPNKTSCVMYMKRGILQGGKRLLLPFKVTWICYLGTII